uniref:GH16 domain-containing protein n=1 Tax=Panagrolaimus sp. JU765 TaxID=591449 RepID=A0AC34RGJ6_9BILA
MTDSNMVLAWSDEFNGDSIDRNKWNFDMGTNNNGWGNNEPQCYTDRPQNAYVSNGCLVIQALRENYGGCSYTSARLKTQGKFSVKYGKFEMRAKLPSGQGMWPAFWLLGDNIGQVGWPACGEIDIMEFIGKDPKNVHGATHGSGFDTCNSYYNGNGFSDWHTYAANWQPYPDRIEFSVDGNIYKTVTPADTHGHWPFNDQNMFIILNLATGGNWPGYPDGSTQFPQQFVIDYVRVYEWAG